LALDEIIHYERMAYAIRETIKLMKKLDKLEI